MPITGSREAQEKSLHDKTVADIAKIRFPFPDKDHPNWKTYLNEPNQTKGIKMNGNTVYPDIVVVDTQKNIAEMIGEIESESTVTSEESEQWKEYSKASNTFYLYVPAGKEDDAKKFLTDNKINISGLRTWQYDSNGKITIANVEL
jgi:hypothetical protein